MKSEIKPYKIEIVTSGAPWYEENVVGHFIKEPYFVVERENGERLLFNNDSIEFIEISKEWINES